VNDRRTEASHRQGRLCCQLFGGFEKAFEVAEAGGVAHFAEGFGFDLTNAFAGDFE
jgi:hypothetical protein